MHPTGEPSDGSEIFLLASQRTSRGSGVIGNVDEADVTSLKATLIVTSRLPSLILERVQLSAGGSMPMARRKSA